MASLAGAAAHEVRPAYLDIREETPGVFSVLLKTPMQGDARLALAASFSGEVEEITPVVSRPTGSAMVQTWQIRAAEPLTGQTVSIDGLQDTMTDALVRIEFLDGHVWLEKLTPDAPEATIPADAEQLGRGQDLSAQRHRAHPVRFRPSAVRVVADADRAGLAHAGEDDHRVHCGAFDHAYLRDARLGDAPSAPVETMIALSHRPGRGRRRPIGARRDQPDHHLALDRRLRIRSSAWLRLRRRAGRGRPAAR